MSECLFRGEGGRQAGTCWSSSYPDEKLMITWCSGDKQVMVLELQNGSIFNLCIYIYIYIYIHTHTHTQVCGVLSIALCVVRIIIVILAV